jgi:DNA-binding response OmpR family regulator
VNIALLEDDLDQALIITEWLFHGGHNCECYASGNEFIQAIKSHTYDILLLDWVLPDMNGIDVLNWARTHMEWRIPIMFITKMNDDEDILEALCKGADDFLTKPIKQKELLARVKVLKNRSTVINDNRDILNLDPYCIDRSHRQINRNGEQIAMTHIEYDLAVFMFCNYDRILSRKYILEHVWGKNTVLNTRTIDTHMSRIRKKMGIYAENGWKLVPIYQQGYRLEKTTTSTN